MATQYTSILKLALPVQGELDGTWGDVVNDNITAMVEEAIAGLATINSWTSNSHTLTSADGTTAESRAAVLELTDTGGALTGAATLICPAASKLYVVTNATGEAVTVKTSGGSGISVPDGVTMPLHCDGTDVVESMNNVNTLRIGGTEVTSTPAELNILDGVTATTAELNILDGVTSTTAELNILDGVTATTAELNILDGVTATTAELNYVDGVTSNVQTQLDTKLSGNQTITLSGDITGSGTTGIATTIADNTVGADELKVTGNGTTSQFLRSDGDGTFTWATPADTNTTYTAGTGLTLVGTEFRNTAPDQTVSLTGSGATSVSGTYPNFTISSTDTNTQLSNEQVEDIVGAMVDGSTQTNITVTYDDASGKLNFVAINNDTTYTAGTGLTLVGTEFRNTAPDQTVTLAGTGATSVSGTYPNFTINSTDTNTTYSAGALLDLSGTTFNVDLSELSTSSTNGDGDYFVVVDTANTQRKLTKSNINISGFNNDPGYITGNQTITLTGDVSGSGTTSIAVTVADDSHNHVIANVDGLQTALNAKADVSGETFTGTVTAPTVGVSGATSPWTMTTDGDDLVIQYNGVDVFKLSTTGDIIAKGNVTAYGTP